MDILLKYFPKLSTSQQSSFEKLEELYRFWNEQINVLSRKDMDQLYERHVLHSLGIAKFINFTPNSKVLDVGTGGGFPGIPLAIMFPDSNFTLVDSIGKKIKVVNEVAHELGLKNIRAKQTRAEDLPDKFHFVVSRAVTSMPGFVPWVKNKFIKKSDGPIKNGIIALKGGDLSDELKPYQNVVRIVELHDYFDEEFFETKKIVYIPSH